MYKQISLSVLTFVAALAFPVTATAETVLRAGEQVSVAAGDVVAEDFYTTAETINVSGRVAGDMYALGGSVTTNGEVAADLAVLGGSVRVLGPVGDDVRVVGGEVSITDTVAGDVFVLGGTLTVLSSAAIEGDVFFFGMNAEIKGDVAGSVYGTAERIRIDAPVAGNVEVTAAESFTLGGQANIAGNVQYRSGQELVRAQNAVVGGTVTRGTFPQNRAENPQSFVLFLFASHLFTLLVFYFLLRQTLARLTQEGVANAAKCAVIGFIAMVVWPVTAAILGFTIVGAPLGIFLFFAGTAMVILSYLLAPLYVGYALLRFRTKTPSVHTLLILAGTAGLYLLGMIPFVGAWLVAAAVIVSFGALLHNLYAHWRT